MALNIIVCVKQVIDPEIPLSAFQIDLGAKRVVPPPRIPPVINGFDEQAVEAALRIKDAGEAKVTVLSVGNDFNLEVMKKPLSMGADHLILVDDPVTSDLDAFSTVTVLVEAIRKIGSYDVVFCGRQASDWDNAHVPLGMAESLRLPCITVAQNIEISNGRVVVKRALPDGQEVVEASAPALVSVSSELGQARNPTLRAIMVASRKTPEVWSAADLGLSAADLVPKTKLIDLYQPASNKQAEFITGDDDEDAGRKLAQRLRELELI